jgi:type IV pilus assembly protein PilC
VGRLLYHGAQTRYCSAGHALLSCGTDLLRTLRLAGQASSSPVLEHDSKRVVKAIQQGLTLSAAMLETPQLYSTTLIQMVRAGEEASLLPEMLQRVAHFHDLELDASIELLSATLEPVLLMGVSAVVGTIVLSIYLPMYSTLMNLTG